MLAARNRFGAGPPSGAWSGPAHSLPRPDSRPTPQCRRTSPRQPSRRAPCLPLPAGQPLPRPCFREPVGFSGLVESFVGSAGHAGLVRSPRTPLRLWSADEILVLAASIPFRAGQVSGSWSGPSPLLDEARLAGGVLCRLPDPDPPPNAEGPHRDNRLGEALRLVCSQLAGSGSFSSGRASGAAARLASAAWSSGWVCESRSASTRAL